VDDDALADTVADGGVSTPRIEKQKGDRVGHFVVEGVLGSGGMGTVYRAHDTRLDRHVALKLIGGSGGSSQDSPEGKARVWREARAAAAFNHPNAVSVYEIGDADAGLFIAMEIVDGEPLRRYVGDTATPLRKKLSFLIDVARALGAAHAVGLVHRDIKPENVMVRRDGTVKVLDFGIARRVNAREPISVRPSVERGDGYVTVEGTIIGTPLYMAPEQMTAGTSLDARADQFSWGVTAYELLTDALPWGDDPQVAMSRVLRGDPPNKHPALPDDVASVIRRTLQRDPSLRYASMDDVVDALSPLLADKKPARRWPIVALAAAVLALIVVAILKRPAPMSAVPEAAAAFEAGMQAFRDGSSTRGGRLMERAAKLDPSFAAAIVREALWEVLQRPLAAGSLDLEAGRALYKQAEVQRAAARPYDRALIEAVEPRFRQQIDLVEAEKRLFALSARYPSYGEPLYWIAMGRSERGDAPGANEILERAMKVEPGMRAALLAVRAWTERKTPSTAIATLDQCLALSHESSDCLGARARMHGFMGHCDLMETDAHAWVAADRDSVHAFAALAEALNARGAPIDSVREALNSAEAFAHPEERAAIADHNKFSLLQVQGDFPGALAQARKLEETLPANAAIAWRLLAVMEISDAALEMGDSTSAGEAALRFLKRADAWTPTSAADLAMPIAILRLARNTGAMTVEEHERQRARWLQRLNAAIPGSPETILRTVWIYAWASGIRTADEARDALEHRIGPVPSPDDTTPVAARLIGHVYRLSGDVETAIPYFRRAAGGCFVLNSVAQSYHARVELADALISVGRKDEAPALYRAVLDRWGAAKPRSITAEHIRQVMQ
jgi:eukaryotic-like serine/threonine-protein kinase